MTEVVIVSGPPGSGKTTVAAALAKAPPGDSPAVHIESDVFYRWISAGFVGPHLKEAHTQNTVVADVAIDAAAAYALGGYQVVWDGVIGPWWLERITRRLAARGVQVRYLVLRPGREVALDRVRERDGTTEVSGAETMYDQFADLGELEGHVIPSDDAPAAVSQRCREAMADDRFLLDAEPWVDDRWPVSAKAVIAIEDRFVVVRNHRGEWELPGGRLDASDDSPAEALRRELREELSIEIEVGEPLTPWIFEVANRRVLILPYRCEILTSAAVGLGEHRLSEDASTDLDTDGNTEGRHHDLAERLATGLSSEHTEVALMAIDELAAATFPSGYLRSCRETVGNVGGQC